MSKPVKEMIMADYKRRFEDLDGALILDIRGVEANANNALRLGLAEKNIRVTVIKNTLAKKAFADTKLQALAPALEGPSALAYGADSVVDLARELVEWAKKVKELDLKGAVLDGEYYDGAEVVQLILSPARQAIGAATAPGSKLLGIIKEIQQRLEEGRTIGKAG
jgi:large subunit ribosomal protein L10